MNEYQDDKHSQAESSASPDDKKPQAIRIVKNFKIRRKMQTVITDFYDSFDRLFEPNHPYVKVKNDAQRARATLNGMYVKRDNINNEITEDVAIKILNQENGVLWNEMKKLNKGLTVIIDEYNRETEPNSKVLRQK